MEELTEIILEREETLKLFAGAIIIAALGVSIDICLDWYFQGRTFNGLATIMFLFLGLAIIGFLIAKEKKEIAELEVYDYESTIEALKADAIHSRGERDEALALLKTATAQAKESERLGKECERLRREQRTLRQSIATAQEEITTAEKALANAVANAKRESAVAVAQLQSRVKSLTPYQDFYDAHCKYKDAMSIVNNRKASDEERAEAQQQKDEAKEAMKIATETIEA